MKPRIPILASIALALLLHAPAVIAQQQPAPPAEATLAVDPDVVSQLQKMGAYLASLKTARIHADTSIDEVLDNGQKVIVTGQVTYQLRKPNGFVIEIASDRKVRQLFYDGKSLTVYAPRPKLYATIDAPPTNQEALDMMSDRYGIIVPLRDLFTWNDSSLQRSDVLTSAT